MRKTEENAGQQELYIRSRLMKGSGAEENQGKKKTFAARTEGFGSTVAGSFSMGNRRRSCSQPFTVVHYVTSGRGPSFILSLLLTGVDIFYLEVDQKDSSNTVERMNTSPLGLDIINISVSKT